MIIEVSYNKYQNDWYVGELYDRFYTYLNSKYKDKVVFTPLENLSKKYGHKSNTYDLNIFNIYNLFVTNKQINKTFIHSLSDYAPAMMDDSSGILNFDVAGFSCTSNLTKDTIKKYSTKYKILPSFYILEKISDLDLIDLYRGKISRLDNVYFNGLCYGHRERYKKIFSKNSFFTFKNKSQNSDYLNKKDYFNSLSSYNFGLSLNGAAKICYRDLEYFGLGVLCLREPLDIVTDEPLIENYHYVSLIDDDIMSRLYLDGEINYINEKISHKINDIIHKKEYYDIINNARKWYENNCILESQIKKIESFLINCNIL